MPELMSSEANRSSRSSSVATTNTASTISTTTNTTINQTNPQQKLHQIESNVITSPSNGRAVDTQSENQQLDKLYATRLPWGVIREKLAPPGSAIAPNLSDSQQQPVNGADLASIEKKKPGEYLMHLIMFNFVQISSKKLEQIVGGDKRVKFTVCDHAFTSPQKMGFNLLKYQLLFFIVIFKSVFF